MFQSPTSATWASGSAASQPAPATRSASSHCSLYCRCGSARLRPFGTYRLHTRTPPHVAPSARASSTGGAPPTGIPREPCCTPVRATRGAAATPLPCPPAAGGGGGPPLEPWRLAPPAPHPVDDEPHGAVPLVAQFRRVPLLRDPA